METCFISSPLGITKIEGDEKGVAIISVLSEGELSTTIPNQLQEAVLQLQEYFEGKRQDFTFKLNPKGTDFQQKCGKNYAIFLSEKLYLISICLKN